MASPCGDYCRRICDLFTFRGQAGVQPVSRCSASRYLAAVFSITSVGRRGAGGVFVVAEELLQEGDRLAAVVQHALLAAGIVLVGWVVLTAMDIALALHLRKYRLDVADNLLARKHLTQARILRRAASVLVILITAGVALMTVPTVRQIGVSLLAAGGAAGIIVGLALQPILSNMMAGVQIALTQPIGQGSVMGRSLRPCSSSWDFLFLMSGVTTA